MDRDYCRRQAAHYMACANQMTDAGDKAKLLSIAALHGRDCPRAAFHGEAIAFAAFLDGEQIWLPTHRYV
jgi:hypothetical protein